MAQGQVAHQHLVGSDVSRALSGKERFELQQYDKIVQFRDAILSGKHPSIKLPTGAGVAVQASNLNAAARKPEAVQPTLPRVPSGPAQVEINPIFLEKSDDLIRAELQLQRQRIERALKEEVDQRRALKHAQAESLSELDLSDVLTKALTLVQATAAAAAPLPPTDDNLTANAEAASDSFDDNTFYSSRHDTPESHLTSRVRNESEGLQASELVERFPPSTTSQGVLVDRQTGAPQQGNQGILRSGPSQTHNGTSANNQPAASQPIQVPGLNNYPDRGVSSTGPSHPASGEQSQSEDSGVMEIEYQGRDVGAKTSQQLRDAYAAIHPPSPLVRTHDSLHAGVLPGPVVDVSASNSIGTPAQVAALRSEPTAATSPESSPQGPNGSKRGKKKKKRKADRQADRQAPDVDANPYIKPEPRSPSPIGGPSSLRPSKRQRFNQRPANDAGHPRQRYEPATIPAAQQDDYVYVPHNSEALPRGYVQPGVPPQRAVSTTVVGGTRYGAGYVNERQIPNDSYLHQYGSPRAPAPTYTPSAGHAARPVAQQVIIDDPYREPQRHAHEPYEVPRMSVRPDAEPLMAAQRPATRIIVDEFGREYLEPPPPSARHSLAPVPRPTEPEVYYERIRAPSRYPEPGSYEDGVVYARPTPAYSMQRRVVTQPEYITQDYRDPRQREFSAARGVGPHEDFVRVMAPPSRRVFEGRPGEYISRSASVRPAESVRYELPQDYGRVQSVRPETNVREYATTTHPEPRREFVQPYLREYGSRPAEQHVIRREYSARPMEQYYDPQAPGGEVAFIERPRGATQEIVYADDARREVYR